MRPTKSPKRSSKPRRASRRAIPGFIVRGIVRSSDGVPEQGARVRACDCGLRAETLLGESRTDAEGRYRISYAAKPARGVAAATANLRVSVIDSAGTERASSDVVFNVPADAVIDVTLPAPTSDASEFERLLAVIAPHLKGQGARAADLWLQDLQPRELDALVRRTGLPDEHVRLLAAAVHESVASGIPAEALYAWFRSGVPAAARAVVSRPSGELLTALREATASSIVPRSVEWRPEDLERRLDSIRIDVELEPAPAVAPASLGDLLNAEGPDWLSPAHRRAVATARSRFAPGSPEFEAELRAAAIAPGDIARVRRMLAVGEVARGHAPVVKALIDVLRENGDSPSIGILAKLGADDWLDLAYDKDPPPGSRRSPEEYADAMAASVEEAAPAASLQTAVATGRFAVAQPGFASIPAFLARNPKLDFASLDVDTFLETADVGGIDESPEQIAGALRQIQATRRLGARWSEASALINAGLGSIDAIAGFGKQRLKRRLGAEVPEHRLAQLADQAQAARSTGLGLLGAVMPVLEVPYSVDESPTLRKLFGPLERCACKACMSVLSPAAYLVDLLRFVENERSAMLALAARRPDVLDLDLSCDNTQIELPYIDLVNEVLENAVGLPYRIELPTTVNIRAELAKTPLTGPVRDALQRTAIEPLGPLAAVPDQWSVRPKILKPHSSYWVVTDRHRRWVLEATDTYFGVSSSIKPGMSVEGISLPALIEGLNNGTVPSAAKARFDQLLAEQVVGALPSSMNNIVIEPIEPGKRWKVQFSAEGYIKLDHSTGNVTLSAAAGGLPWTKRYSQKGVAATESALSQNQLGGVLRPIAGLAPYHIKKELGNWTYVQTRTVEIVFRAAGLAITGLTYQSTAADRDLYIRPQHRNPIAYEDHLKTAVFPWDAPFDLNLTETRALLARSRSSRLAIVEAATPRADRYTNAVLARERAGFSQKEWEIVTTSAAGAELWKRWGLVPSGNEVSLSDSFVDATVAGAPIAVLARLSILMQQGRLTFAEVENLLQSEYINPARTASIVPPQGCDPTRLTVQNLTEALADRFSRFVRLQRRLGWSVRDLDIAMRRISPAGPTPDGVRDLIGIRHASERLRLSVEMIATWIGGFDRSVFTAEGRRVEPLYERIFQDRRLLAVPDPDLAFDRIAASALTIADKAPLVAAALGIEQTQLLPLLRLRAPAPIGLSAAPLDQDNLRALLGHATLSRSLAVPVDQYVVLARLIGAAPFSSVTALLEFCDDVDLVKASGFDPAVVAYVLNNAEQEGAQWMLTAERARTVLAAMQTALREATQADSGVGVSASADGRPPVASFSQEDVNRLQTAPATNADRWIRWGLTVAPNGTATWVDPDNATITVSGSPLTVLARARVLAVQSGVPVDELRDLLQTRFVDPTTPPALSIPAALPPTITNLTAAHLDRLERLLILRRGTGLSVYELDLVIRALGAPTVAGDPLTIDLIDVVDRLRWLVGLRDRLGLPLDVVASWWSGLGGPTYVTYAGTTTTPIASVFDRLFPATPAYADFALSGDRTRLQIEAVPPTPKPTLSQYQGLLARTFGADESTVRDVVRFGGLPNADLTLANLSQLHRVLTLARAVGIPPRTLVRIRTSAGVDPFQGPRQAFEFVDTGTKWHRRVQIVVSRIADAFGLDATIAGELLWEHLTGQPYSQRRGVELFVDPSLGFANRDAVVTLEGITTTPEYAVLLKTHKVALLNSVWKLSAAELAWLSRAVPFDDLASSGITTRFPAWRQSAVLLQIARKNPAMPAVIDRYFAAVAAAATDDRITEGANVLAGAFDVPVADVQAAAGADLLAIVPSQAGEAERLSEWMGLALLLKKLAITAAELKLLIASEPGAAAAEAARRVLRSSFGEEGWRQALRAAANEIREQQRHNLMQYLVRRDGLRDADSLYDRYLIDVQMSPCMTTTRLLQTVAAVQLFVQRCVMNLEPAVSAGDVDPDGRWRWIKNYRVWEANRKVFLHPENWLFPELRDDKSETFRAFEGVLTQSEANAENADRAVREYLDSLLEVSQISVMAMYEHVEAVSTDGVQKYRRTLYVVGRSPNPPYIFYWRRALRVGEPGMRWTGWERIDLDLSGDHVVPFVFEGDFHVVWPVIAQTRQDNKEFYDVQLAWARHTTIGWTKRKVSRESAVRIQKYLNRDIRTMLALRITDQTPNPEQIAVGLYSARKTASVIAESSITSKNALTTSVAGYANYLYQQWTLAITARAYVRFTSTSRIASVSDCTVSIRGLTADPYYPDDPAYKMSGVYGGANPDRVGPYPVGAIQKFTIRGDPGLVFEATATVGGQTLTVESAVWDAQANNIQWKDEVQGTIDFLFETETDPEFSDPFEPVEMRLEGKFFFLSGRETQWIALPSATPSTLAFPAGTLPWGGGFLEQTNGTSGLPGVFASSRNGSRYLALKSWRAPAALPAGPDELWYCEEKTDQDDARFFLRKSLGQPGQVLAIHPSAYAEAGGYKARFATAPDTLYSVASQEPPVNPQFGVASLGSYVPAKIPGGNDPRDRALIAFDLAYPYASYNWELFFHVPITAARFLASQQRFRDAERWLRCVFDPTTSDLATGPQRFWRFLPFRHAKLPDTIEELMTALANPNADSVLKARALEQIDAWVSDPFNPFAIARLRTSAFEWHTIVSWIKNLIAEGDSLFRRDTREAVQEATLLYVMAAKILGRRPAPVHARGLERVPMSYRALAGRWDDFANAWVTLVDTPLGRALLEILMAFARMGGINPHAFDDQIEQLTSVASLYFCIPRNEALDSLWDAVEDRLFKIRHCRNIDGVARELPLFEPPIDPELLIRARAAGLDIEDVLNDRFAPAPRYRFGILVQKAMELCGEVRALGSAALAAIEKKDAERLALIRSTQELELLDLVRRVKEDAIAESDATIESLRASRATALDRFGYLQRLLGRTEMTLDAAGVPVVPQTLSLQVQETGAPNDFRNLALIHSEIDQIGRMQDRHVWSVVSGALKTSASVSHGAAGVAVAAAWMDPTDKSYKILEAVAQGLSALGDGAGMMSTNALGWEQRAGMIAAFQRRREEWIQQSKTAVDEIRQIDKQIVAAQIKKDIAEKDLNNHNRTMEHARAIDDYLRREKFTSADLYTWMENRLAEVHFAAYQLAFALAKRAERAFRIELGQPDAAFLGFGPWESGKKGLLAGERLAADLNRMQVAYLDQNQREYELTKHVSLWMLDPEAVLSLRQTGRCEVALAEALFDLDCPGHYFRRIKSAALTIPSITGPYTAVNCTLTLLKSSIRHSPAVATGYARERGRDDRRFTDVFGAIQSIVTSSGQSDTGLFETNLRDERFLPFEGAGAVGAWRIELPNDFRQFDYDTIADVILHLRYTARDGGEALKQAAASELQTALNGIVRESGDRGLARAFSLRQEFPTEWHRFRNPTGTGSVNTITLPLGVERFPYLLQARSFRLDAFELFVAVDADVAAPAALDTTNLKITFEAGAAGSTDAGKALALSEWNDLLTATRETLGAKAGAWTLTAWRDNGGTPVRIDPDAITDIVAVCRLTL